MYGGGDFKALMQQGGHQQTEASIQILGNIPLLLLTVAYFSSFPPDHVPTATG